MASEKLGKAYFRRPGHSPLKSYATFVPFLRAIGSLPKARRGLIADLFQFQSYLGFQVWINAALPLAYDLERLAPAFAQDEPNPEYPWPQDAPTDSPISFEFPIWQRLTKTSQGRQFLQTLQILVAEFPRYA